MNQMSSLNAVLTLHRFT